MKNTNFDFEKMAADFISCEIDIYGLDDCRGKTFDELYPFGNDSVDSDIQIFIDENNYELSEEERELLFHYIYTYII